MKEKMKENMIPAIQKNQLRFIVMVSELNCI